MNMFTNGQIARMRALFDTQTGIRREILSYSAYLTTPVTPTFSGPLMVGGTTSGSIIVTNKPANATLTWSYNTNLLTQVSSSANSIVLKPKTATTVGDATVTATLSYPGGVQKSANRYVGVGGPHYMNVQLVVTASSDGSQAYPSGGLCPNSYYYAYLDAGTTLTNVNWGASSHLNVISASNSQLYFGTNSAGYGMLSITATVPAYGISKNILGVTLMGGGCSKGSSYSKVLSVPSANRIEVEFDMDTYKQQVNTQVYPKAPAFDIRMFNIAGILVKQATSSGETVQLDVSSLPNGAYVIHIYDGISPTPEVHKVQVAN